MPQTPAAIIRSANADLLVEGDLDAAEKYFTTGYVAHVTDRDLEGGRDGVRRFVTQLRRAFSDIRVEVDVLAEAGDRVAWMRTFRAKHTGDFMGFPATGRPIVWRDMLASRFEGDQIAEEWAVSDLAERLLRARKG